MVKGRKPVVFEEETEEPILLEDSETLPQQIAELIEREGAGDYKIFVTRKPENQNQIFRIPETYFAGDGFDANAIARDFGGGLYTFTIHRPNGTFLKRWSCNYASKKISEINTQPKEQSETGKQLIDMVKSQLDAVREENKLIREESKKAMPEMLQTLVALISAMKVNQPVIQPQQQADPLDTMIKLKSLFPDNNGGDNTSKILEALKLGREFAKDSKSDGGSSPLEEKLIMKLVDVIAPSIEKKLAGGFNKMKPQIQKPNFPPIVPETPSETPPAVPSNGGDADPANADAKVLKYIGENIKRFSTLANKNTPVESVGDFIYQSLEEQDYDDLILFLQSGGSDKIFNTYPELMLHKEWVLRLIDNLINPPDENTGNLSNPEIIEAKNDFPE